MAWSRSGYLTIGTEPVKGLDFSFDIRKTLSPAVNTAYITIMNLGQSLRNRLMADRQLVEVYGGYEDDVVTRLFVGATSPRTGDIHTFERDGTWVTQISCADGDEAQSALVHESFEGRVGVVDIVRALVNALVRARGIETSNLDTAVRMGYFSRAAGETAKEDFQNGWIATGKAIETLSILLKSFGLRWSIQDRALEVLPDHGVLPGPPIDLRSVPVNKGLIGSPRRTSKGGVIATVLLDGRIRPGRRITVNSRDVTFDGRADIVQHIGSTWSQPWYTVLEAADFNNLDAYDVDPFLS